MSEELKPYRCEGCGKGLADDERYRRGEETLCKRCVVSVDYYKHLFDE